jgi:UDP-glucuronate 4-epimerase
MNYIKNKKILITGGAGFLGGHIAEKFLSEYGDVIIVDNFNSETTPAKEKEKTVLSLEKKAKKNKRNISIYRESITNEKGFVQIMIKEKPHIVIHAAALAMDRASMDIPIDFIETNVRGSQIVLTAIEKSKSVEQVILISTRSAVGEVPNANSFMSESDHFRPINPYGATKAASESFFHSFHFNTKIPVKVCRMQPIYGPRCRHDMFVWRILNSILTGKKIQKYGNGEAVRDWLYIDDAVNAIIEIINHKMSYEILNIGTGKCISTNELINTCEKIAEKPANIENIPAVPGDAHFAGIADCTKIKNLIGWEARVSLSEGIHKTFLYMNDKHRKNS